MRAANSVYTALSNSDSIAEAPITNVTYFIVGKKSSISFGMTEKSKLDLLFVGSLLLLMISVFGFAYIVWAGFQVNRH
jgi:hypothetical protein